MDASTSLARGNLWTKTRQWTAAHPKWTLALAVFIALGPFLAKPFNMDDPLFIWTAQQIQAHPGNPYGFGVNWYGYMSPMWEVTQNPPLASYYLALAGGILGWSEIALHGALLLPALAVILGTYRLAKRFCDQPLFAALATLFTPVFLVSSTTVMCDVLMLSFWVWAVFWWVEATERDALWPLAGAGLLIALAALTKYFGVCLIPLLAVYSLSSKRRVGWWAVFLLIPLLALGVYEWAMHSLYKHDALWNAVDYASGNTSFFNGARTVATLTTLTFTGGCIVTALFLAPWLWRARTLLSLVCGSLLLVFAFFQEGTFWKKYYWIDGWFSLSVEAQIIFWTIGGVSVLALALADTWNHRDAPSWLLALWVLGTFIFTAYFNWTINGRSILPMAPAMGILLARRLQLQTSAGEKKPAIVRLRIIIPLAASMLLAFLVAQSDFLLATAVRKSAELTQQHYGRAGRTIWFQGHWGFQYYMTLLGGQAVDKQLPTPRAGDALAIPINNTNLEYPPGPKQGFNVPGPWLLTDQNMYVCASFYSASGGPLPFVFGHIPPESITLYFLRSGRR